MNTLIVTSHPEPASFNHAMAAATAEALRSAGHQVEVVDLYREGFDPVVRPDQFSVRKNRARFEVMEEQAYSAAANAVAPDVARSQRQLRWADNLVLQFPLWWWSLPAQLKGWVDRVLSAGFAYGGSDLAGRRAMLTVTAETRGERFDAEGADNPLHHIERGMLKFCGFQALPAFVVADVYRLSHAEREDRLERLRDHVRLHLGAQRISRSRARATHR